MAKFTMHGTDDFISQLEALSSGIGRVQEKMINGAAPILKDAMSDNIRAAADRGYATGALASSVRATKAKKNNYGYFAAVRVTGKDKKGVRNGEKLAYLEYGVEGGQQAHPVMAKTMRQSEEAVVRKMQEVFDQETGI